MNAKRNGTKPIKKAPSMVFRIEKSLAEFLRKEAEKNHKTMTSILEELLAYRRQFKSWPPEMP
jgi:hypothetical protein